MADASSEISYSARDRIWSKLNKCLGVMIAVGIALPLAYKSLPVVREKAAQDMHIAELENRLDLARMLNRRLNREVQLLATDPDFLGTFTRDGLPPGYRKEGETIFRIDPREKR